MEVSMEKKYMVIGAEGQDLITDKGVMKQVREYKYLGVQLTSDG